MEQVGPKRFNHKEMGERSEAIIIGKLVYAGYTVLKPYGENQRYDLVIEDAERNFWRVQCKTAWMEKRGNGEVVKFATASCHYHYRSSKYNYGRQGYQGQVDYFAVYSPDLDKVYLIPIDHAGTSDMSLRLTMPRGRNQHGINLAENYEL